MLAKYIIIHVVAWLPDFVDSRKNPLHPSRGSDEPERVYPSQTRWKYYEYYIQYFTLSSRMYAMTAENHSRTARMCTNMEPFYNNETILGRFPCPMQNDLDSFTHCCGESGYQYCCTALDNPNVRLQIGLGAAAALGIIVGVIVCVVLQVQHRQRKSQAKEAGTEEMIRQGIPRFNTMYTGDYTAKQTDDGYQIVVTFATNKAYAKCWKAVTGENPTISWKKGVSDAQREGTIVMADGSWVNLVFTARNEGGSSLVVARNKSAVVWMTNDFLRICPSQPQMYKRCPCFPTNKIHNNSGSSAATSVYQLSDGATGSTDSRRWRAGSGFSENANKYEPSSAHGNSTDEYSRRNSTTFSSQCDVRNNVHNVKY